MPPVAPRKSMIPRAVITWNAACERESGSARERAVVALTFYAERSTDGIARELATSPGNVRVVRHRALARLHERLERA